MSCTNSIGQSPVVPELFCAAKTLQSSQRQELAIQVLAGTQPVAALARENNVSRKFLYTQAEKAQLALEEVFAEVGKESQVLFYLPVTKQWICQLVLGLVLISHSSMRGVVELLRDVFDLPLSLGTVHNILCQAVALATVEKLASKIERAKGKSVDEKLPTRLAAARLEQEQGLSLACDIAQLEQWMRQDILALVGPDLETRRTLFDWVVEELRMREDTSPHRIAPIRKKLENHREEILGFVGVLEQSLQSLAKEQQVSPSVIWEIYQLQGQSDADQRLHQAEAALWEKLGERYHFIRQAVRDTLTQTVRASSIVENLNSRLRCYFFLRRELGPAYLDLLRFFLNHRRFLRSERPERQGKSPVEILTGQAHPHWLESLGFQLFTRAA